MTESFDRATVRELVEDHWRALNSHTRVRKAGKEYCFDAPNEHPVRRSDVGVGRYDAASAGRRILKTYLKKRTACDGR